MSKKAPRFPNRGHSRVEHSGEDDGNVRINTDPRSELGEGQSHQEYLPKINFLQQSSKHDELDQSTYRPKFKPLESQGLKKVYDKQTLLTTNLNSISKKALPSSMIIQLLSKQKSSLKALLCKSFRRLYDDVFRYLLDIDQVSCFKKLSQLLRKKYIYTTCGFQQEIRQYGQADFKRIQSGIVNEEDEIMVDYYRGRKQGYANDNADINKVVGNQRQNQNQEQDQRLSEAPSDTTSQASNKTQPQDELYQYMLKLNEEEFDHQLKKFHQISQILIPVESIIHKQAMQDASEWGIDFKGHEHTHCRYTPIVSQDSRYFESDGYNIRQNILDGGRRIKMCIVITLYNEDFSETFGTLMGIANNINNMQKKNKKFKKYPDWKEILVVLVQDGVEKANISTLAGLEQIGLYHPGFIIKKNRLKEDTTAHLFEYTAKIKDEDKGTFTCPIQMSFLTKAKNAGKLSSHAWFYNAVCESIQPEYTVLFDAGTTPYPKALGNMFRCFEDYPNCGACAGELEVDKPFQSFWAVVQYLEWKFAYILEVPLQHLSGYMQVLPGAFSAYRWKAIKGAPLDAYFRGYYKEESMNTFLRNVYLAEDRVLCVEVVAKTGCNYKLRYVKKARARADPCPDLQKLMGQRRRWLNGSFFAAVFGFMQLGRVLFRTKHGFLQKMLFFVEFFYLAFNLFFSNFLGVALVFTFMKVVVQEFFINVTKGVPNGDGIQQIGTIILAIYSLLLIVQIITNMNNKPGDVKWIHNTSAIIFGFYTLMFTAFLLYFIFKPFNPTDWRNFFGLPFASIVIVIMSILLVVVVILHGYIWPFISGGIQYYFMSAAYTNVLQIYAFTNSHDLSWGTKGLTGGSEEGKKKDDVLENIKKARTRYRRRTEVHGGKDTWENLAIEEKQKTFEELNKERESRENIARVFSTRLILYWLTFNLLFLFVISRLSSYPVDIPCGPVQGFACGEGTSISTIYLQILLAVLGAFRIIQLVVSLVYIIQFQCTRCCCGRKKKSRVQPISQQATPDFVKNKRQNQNNNFRPPPQQQPPQGRPSRFNNNNNNFQKF